MKTELHEWDCMLRDIDSWSPGGWQHRKRTYMMWRHETCPRIEVGNWHQGIMELQTELAKAMLPLEAYNALRMVGSRCSRVLASSSP